MTKPVLQMHEKSIKLGFRMIHYALKCMFYQYNENFDPVAQYSSTERSRAQYSSTESSRAQYSSTESSTVLLISSFECALNYISLAL